MQEEYTENQWLEEKASQRPVWIMLSNNEALRFGGTVPCPKCGVVGFYVAAESTAVPQYRMCKFCGLWQQVGELQERCSMFYHQNCPSVQNHSSLLSEALKYSWRSGGGKECECQQCKATIFNIVNWPSEDKAHPFNRLRTEGQLRF